MPSEDLFEAARLRDSALAGVETAAKGYFQAALDKMRQWRLQGYPGSDFCMEDIVRELVATIGPMPSKYVPGSIACNALKQGLMLDTGSTRRSTDKKKHAHKNTVYRWKGFA